MNKKRVIIILSAAALLAAALILYYNLALKGKRSIGEYTASIDALIFAGDYSGAVAECSDGIRHYPESTELYLLKARAYLLWGDTEKAIGTLDYGYKQTQSDTLLERREQIAEVFVDNVEFIPLTGLDTSSENNDPDGSSAASGVSGDSEEAAMEAYYPDSPIKVTIPNVSPPPA